MNEFCFYPNIYKTGHSTSLLRMLERVWVRECQPGEGTIFIMSGFGNYNGGVRFYPSMERHVQNGGTINAFFSGSTSQKLTSKQVVTELLNCGARVYIINRKRLMHAKCYGRQTGQGGSLIVTSGNFTGPGMSQNAEAAILLDSDSTKALGFSWDELIGNIFKQKWTIYEPGLNNQQAPAWNLLYDETVASPLIDESELMTMIIILGHADTARIQAFPGSNSGKGTQYFWLSKDCYDFFPALTLLNVRGWKKTYSCMVKLEYVDLGEIEETRVTFEADNNLDFRLGTGKFRYTRLAAKGDLAAITRTAESAYSLRIFRKGSVEYNLLAPHAINFIGHVGKKYGYISNDDFAQILRQRSSVP